ncbi:MAG TPA: carboxypeptidase regulatory-like domain-containing protein [Kofleriaceae bacterium]|nr:carboxypeptidase regulatory-like domain-containing protein [Kofleriaceae bacterium]
MSRPSSPLRRPALRRWHLGVLALGLGLAAIPWRWDARREPVTPEPASSSGARDHVAASPWTGTRELPALGRIDRGTVVAGDGEPLAGVEIYARAAGGDEDDALLAHTDADGGFTVIGLPDGTYELTLRGPSIFAAATRWQVPGPPIRILVPRRLTIGGVVREGSRPIAGATVALSDGALSMTQTTTTDAQGRFELRDLPDANYVVWAWHGAAASALLAGAPEVELALEPATVVEGRVVDRNGGAGVAARVVLIAAGDEGAARSGVADAEGNFRIDGVPRGRWRVQLDAPGYLARTSYEVSAAEERERIDLEVVRGGVAAGRVLDPYGAPVADAAVLVRGADRKSQTALELARASAAQPTTKKPSSGAIRWQHPLAGARLLPSHDGRRFGAHREGDRPEECGMGHCGVDLGHQQGAVVHAAADGVIRTIVRRSSGRAGRFISIEHAGALRTQYMHLDEIREDLLPGMSIRGGDPLGTVGTTGVLRSGPHLHFTLAQQQGARMWFIDPEPLLRHAVVRAHDAPLSVPGIEGMPDQVVAAVRLEPAPDLDGGAVAAAPIAYRATTGYDGGFELGGLPDGRYVVTALHAGYARGRSAPFAIDTRNASATGVDVELSSGVVVYGQVRDDRGAPIAGAHVTAEAGESLDARQIGGTLTDGGGYFELAPLDGAITLKVSAPAHGELARAVTLRNRGLGVDRREELFELLIADAELRGQVRDPAGQPLAGARLTVVGGAGGRSRGTRSSAAGEVFIPALPAGDYQVRVDAPGYPSLRAGVKTGESFELTVEAGGGVRIEVRDLHTRGALAGAAVHARGPDGDERRAVAGDGLLELTGLRAGRWTLSVRAAGYVTTRRTVEVPAGRDPGDITADETRIELARGAEIGGLVLDGNGERVAGARLEIGGVEGTTDQDGRFRLREVPAGSQTLRARRGEAAGELVLTLAPGDEQITLQLTID